jgi:hypothetical protein
MVPNRRVPTSLVSLATAIVVALVVAGCSSDNPLPRPSSAPQSAGVNLGPVMSPSPSPSPRSSNEVGVGPAFSVTVPDLTCQTFAEAKRGLEDAGLAVKVGDPVPVLECSTTGLVEHQEPGPGTNVDAGTVVTIHLSEG